MTRTGWILLSIAATLAMQGIIGAIEISDYRKGKRRLAQTDIDSIVDGINNGKTSCSRDSAKSCKIEKS